MKRLIHLLASVAFVSGAIGVAVAAETGGAAPSTVGGKFDSTVKMQGVTQRAEGEQNTQDLSIGSVKGSKIDGDFFTNVEIKGDITQSATGKNNTQNLNVGSAVNNPTVGSFENKFTSTGAITQTVSDGDNNAQNIAVGSVENSTVTGSYTNEHTKTGAITQTVSGGDLNQQNIAVGSVQNSTVKDYKATNIETGNLTQTVEGGSNNLQKMAIGSATDNSKVEGGTFTTEVKLGDVSQTATGIGNQQYIDAGSMVRSTVTGDFTSKVEVTGKITQSAENSTTQDVLLGSMLDSTANSFTSDVTVNGDINQTATGSGHTQSATFGSVR